MPSRRLILLLALLAGAGSTRPAAADASWLFAPPPTSDEIRSPLAAAVEVKPPAGEQGENPQAEALRKKINEMASDLFNHLGGDDSDPKVGLLSDGIVVCAFVDLKKIDQTSSFGRYLAEQTMSEFQRRGFTVFEMRKSKTIKIQEKKGEFGLSQHPGEITSTIPARTMITGTYTAVRDHLLVNVRVIDNKTGALLAAATTLFPRTQAIDQLLAESAALTPPQKTAAKSDQILYLKKLEL